MPSDAGKWPLVALGELLREEKARIGTFDANGLQLLGVSNSAGLHRSGMPRIADMSRYLRVERDWFAYNPMRINVGSLGWAADDSLNGVISPDYVVFSSGPRVLPELVYWFLKHRRGLQAINFATAGSVRERLFFNKLSRIEFPLPPLAEQRRVVARINAIAARVAEAERLRGEADAECRHLVVGMARRLDLPDDEKLKSGWREVTLGEVLRPVVYAVPVDTSVSYHNLGIYSYARGLFKKPDISGIETSAKTLYRVRTGQFIYSRLFAFEGAYGVVGPEFDGHYVSNEYPTFDCNPELATSDFVGTYFSAKDLWPSLAAGSKGLGDRRQRVQPEQLLRHKVLLPPLANQRTISDVIKALDRGKSERQQTAAELAALLPAVLDRAFRGEL